MTMALLITKKNNVWYSGDSQAQGESDFANAEAMCEFLVNHGFTSDDELDKAILHMAANNANTGVFNEDGSFGYTVDAKG
jgi:hypothetical protein